MIPATILGRQPASPPTWQHELASAITHPEALARALDLDPGLFAHAGQASVLFPLRVPLSFVRRMRTGDPNDPLLRQVMPLAAELTDWPGFGPDPLAELSPRELTLLTSPDLVQLLETRHIRLGRLSDLAPTCSITAAA